MAERELLEAQSRARAIVAFCAHVNETGKIAKSTQLNFAECFTCLEFFHKEEQKMSKTQSPSNTVRNKSLSWEGVFYKHCVLNCRD